MNYTIGVIFSASIAIAAVIGLVRYKKISPVYYPFLLLVWVALLNEILSYILARTIRNNMLNNNIYPYVEVLLITIQFHNWRLFERTKKLFPVLLILFSACWLVEVLFISDINRTTFYSPVFFSFITVFMSISTINKLIVREKKNILRNSDFLICTGFVIYFTLKVIVQTFWLYGLGASEQFFIQITYAHLYVNLLTNLIYALAVLWMPNKQRFSMPS